MRFKGYDATWYLAKTLEQFGEKDTQPQQFGRRVPNGLCAPILFVTVPTHHQLYISDISVPFIRHSSRDPSDSK